MRRFGSWFESWFTICFIPRAWVLEPERILFCSRFSFLVYDLFLGLSWTVHASFSVSDSFLSLRLVSAHDWVPLRQQRLSSAAALFH
jgi:hypothetical protein